MEEQFVPALRFVIVNLKDKLDLSANSLEAMQAEDEHFKSISLDTSKFTHSMKTVVEHQQRLTLFNEILLAYNNKNADGEHNF